MKTVTIIVLLITVGVVGFANDISVGSFNIEWFGHGNKPKTDEQIRQLSAYIKSLEVDILACQEINPSGDTSDNDVPDWEDLGRELGAEYQLWHGDTGRSQKLAFIWRTDRVEVTDLGELRGISREEVEGTNGKTFPRIPVTAFVRSRDGDLDFRIVTVHLYWSDDLARYAEAKQLNTWMRDFLAGDDDEDLVLIGDFNTKPMGSGESQDSQVIENLERESMLACVSKQHLEYTTPDSEERYDHAFLSQDLGGEYVEESWDVRREIVAVYPELYQRDISNHVPVTLRLIDEDNDEASTGDWGE